MTPLDNAHKRPPIRGTRDFLYDNQRQLTNAYKVDGNNQPLPNYNFSYSFDFIGNWKSTTNTNGTTNFTANILNQYSQITTPLLTQNPVYDLNGNMLSDGKGNTFIYDEENRLVEADTPGLAITKVVSIYDGLSRRVEKDTYNGATETN